MFTRRIPFLVAFLGFFAYIWATEDSIGGSLMTAFGDNNGLILWIYSYIILAIIVVLIIRYILN